MVIPHLTYFVFNDVKACTKLYPALLTCDRLRCIVLLGDVGEDSEDSKHIADSGMAEDPRFVLVNQQNFFKDWQLGAAGRDTFWDVADDFITARRNGIIDREYGFPSLLLPPDTC